LLMAINTFQVYFAAIICDSYGLAQQGRLTGTHRRETLRLIWVMGLQMYEFITSMNFIFFVTLMSFN